MKKIIYTLLVLLFTVSSQAQIDINQQPKPGVPPTVHIRKPQSFKLPNGLTVLVVENHKLPSVSIRLTLDNPLSVEGDKKGIEDLISKMMGNGTSSISKDEFNDQIDLLGASIYFGISNAGATTLSRYYPRILSLLAQGVLDPLFTQEELDSERAKLLDELKSEEKSAQAIARSVSGTLIYGKNHPRGEPLTSRTINDISLSDVKTYYKNSFVPEKAYLVIVGDVKFAEVKEIVEKEFLAWEKRTPPVSKYDEAKNLAVSEINIVDVPNAVQSEIQIANLVDLKITDPDYFAARLANQILGGGADGRLFTNLREKHGWTYGSYSSIRGDKEKTTFVLSASVRNAVTDSAVVEMLNEVNKIRSTLVTQEELDLAKAKYIGSFVMEVEKPQTVARLALQQKIQGLSDDYYENYIINTNAVNLEEVHAAAKKYFLEDKLRIIIVGKADEIVKGLEKLNIPIKYYDRYGTLLK